MMSFRSVFVPLSIPAVLALLLAPQASAQTVISRISSLGYTTEVVFDGGVQDEGEVVMVDAPQPEVAETKAPKKPTAREEKLKKLEYDRRPSAVLAAWSNPPKPPEEEKAADTAAVAEPETPAAEPDAAQATEGDAEPAKDAAPLDEEAQKKADKEAEKEAKKKAA